MSANKRTQALQDMLTPAVHAAGCVLWGLEFISQGRHSVLRLFIDSENGITLDDCEAVSRQVSAVLDVEDPINSEYNLEVSSPGLDRPLFTVEQFAQYVGENVKIRLKMAVAGRRNFTAKLEKAADQTLTFSDQEDSWEVPFSQVDKANLVPVFD